MQSVYEGLILDVDGTLFDIKEYIPVFRGVMIDAIYEVTGRRLNLTADEVYTPHALPQDESDRFLEKAWEIKDSGEFWGVVEKLDMERRKQMIGTLKVFPDVEALRSLKGDYSLKLGILSNAPESIVEMQLNHYGIGDIFDHMVCSPYKNELSKPGTLGLEILLKRMGLGKGGVVIIGDSDVDEGVSRNAGIPFIKVVRNHNHCYDFEGDHISIENLHQLGGVLHEMPVRQEGSLFQEV